MAEIYGSSGFERERDSEARSEEPSIAQLIGDLIADGQTLIRKELELARTEITDELGKARESAITLGLGGGLAAVGGIFLLLMLVHLLSDVFGLPLWVGYLIVGGILAVAGGLLLNAGLNRIKQVDPVPRETIESVRKDVEWLKEQNPSDKI